MLPSYRTPIKRNRNSGTKNAGFKRQSNFQIPSQNHNPFYENLKSIESCSKNICGRDYRFVIEKLNKDYSYACCVDEICNVLEHVPNTDLEGLNLIIFRQPKEKEFVLNSCWGRLIYYYKYQNKLQPAIILEAINLNRCIRMKKANISPFLQRELNMLEYEGHEIVYDKKYLTIKTTFQSAKITQLYRTLLHEIGHYVYYKKGFNINDYEEKESYANRYAEFIKSLL
jgi:hypothetical protein